MAAGINDLRRTDTKATPHPLAAEGQATWFNYRNQYNYDVLYNVILCRYEMCILRCTIYDPCNIVLALKNLDVCGKIIILTG